MKTAIKSQFSIDGTFPHIGYTFGTRWNGWACPSFELDEAKKIAEFVSYAEGYEVVYIEETDKFIEYTNKEWTDEWEAHIIETVDGPKKVYSIGAFGWVWANESDYNN